MFQQTELRSFKLLAQGDRNRSLFELVNDLREHILEIPHHQREFVWEEKGEEKIRGWVERIGMPDRLPVGAIVTYQIDNGRPSRTYINDGSQRLRATDKFLREPGRYGDYDKKTAEEIVRTVSMPVQHRHYPSQDAALEDFQWLNLGTSLTPFEFCKGILTYMEDFEAQWEPLFDRLHRIVDDGVLRVSEKKTINRPAQHKFYRHDYALFVRFLTHTKELVNYRRIAAQEVRRADLQDKRAIEWLIRTACKSYGIAAVRKEISRFESFVDRESAGIETIWRNVRRTSGIALSRTLYRWLLEVAIWRTNTEASVEAWTTFVTLLLEATDGDSVLKNEKTRRRTTLGLGSLGGLKTVCEIIGSSFYEGKVKRVTQKRTIPGYDQSHLFPVSTHGEGPTTTEPASLNRARGAKPIEDDPPTSES